MNESITQIHGDIDKNSMAISTAINAPNEKNGVKIEQMIRGI
jgi:hypothetical protein